MRVTEITLMLKDCVSMHEDTRRWESETTICSTFGIITPTDIRLPLRPSHYPSVSNR